MTYKWKRSHRGGHLFMELPHNQKAVIYMVPETGLFGYWLRRQQGPDNFPTEQAAADAIHAALGF
jgi:hypothetical protein